MRERDKDKQQASYFLSLCEWMGEWDCGSLKVRKPVKFYKEWEVVKSHDRLYSEKVQYIKKEFGDVSKSKLQKPLACIQNCIFVQGNHTKVLLNIFF